MALFITFEGLDHSGKSTQVRRLESRLQRAGRSVLVLREPGGTPVGETIRHILLDKGTHGLTDAAEVFLFSASRAQLVEYVIRPALEKGQAVICDRFFDSTTAYQGAGRGISADIIRTVNRWATGGLTPHVTFFLDISPAEVQRRMHAAATRRDRMESGGDDFYGRVRERYLGLAKEEARFKVIDGTRTVEAIEQEIWKHVEAMMTEEKHATT